jgi:glycosyltransferase involved in cell wall biosynthesis
MSELRILHITPWFKSDQNPSFAPFISDQILALQEYSFNEVLHLEIDQESNGCLPYFESNEYFLGEIKIHRTRFKNFPKIWRVYEILCSYLIDKHLADFNEKYDIVNFFIAYPTAIQLGKYIEKYPDLVFTITEHWSAYHFGFNLSKGNSGRRRIENIFKNNIPLFVVSNSLGKDIQKFCSCEIPYRVIPNIVDTSVFGYRLKKQTGEFWITSINGWSEMKNPFVLMRAFKMILSEIPQCRLIFGGGGNLLSDMKLFSEEQNINDKTSFTGVLDKIAVAKLLSNSDVYCQCSNYETFSIICAEALCSGVPVVASNVGGIKDFVNSKNGILLDSFEPQDWANAILHVIRNKSNYDLKNNSAEIQNKYSSEAVGKLFYENLRELM